MFRAPRHLRRPCRHLLRLRNRLCIRVLPGLHVYGFVWACVLAFQNVVVLGGVVAFGSATEFQSTNDPHIHGEVHIVCIYQFSTLEEIANEIKKKLLDPKTVFDFNAWLHREEPFNPTRLVVFFCSS